jgi:hypothetical protein
LNVFLTFLSVFLSNCGDNCPRSGCVICNRFCRLIQSKY